VRGGIVALGVVLMLIGFALFVATSPIEFLGIEIGQEQPTIEIAGLKFPLNLIGLFMAGLGFVTFIAGIAASGKS